MTIISQIKILSPLTVNFRKPKNIIAKDELLFANDLKKDLPEAGLFFFKGLNVTPEGIIFNKLSVLKKFLIWPKHTKDFGIIYLLKNFIKRKKVATNADTKFIICFDYWSLGYFHWICDFLPRLVIAEKELEGAVLLLPENHKATFVEPCLKALGIKNTLRFSMREYIRCENAIVPGYVTNSGDHRPEIMLKIRDRLFNSCYLNENKNKYPENIYISRSKAKGRFIENEKEIEKILSEKGFEIIYFEDYSFSEQIALAYNAKNYIGLHGANLTNLIFMKPDTNILELRREDDKESNYYFSLSSTFNINYYYQKCSYNYDSNIKNYNLIVDLPLFEKNISSMLAQTN